MTRITLTGKGRRWIEDGHPWAYADDVQASEAQPGDLVLVEGPNAKHLGYGLFSAGSKIAVRLVTRGKERPERAFWERRIGLALAARERAGLLGAGDACRLVAGDADGVPGLVIDRYADVLVCQSGTQGADKLQELVLDVVERALPWKARAVVERSDAGVRKLEQLPPRTGVLRGELPAELVVKTAGLAYEVDVLTGHKTGHYLDQRNNRQRAATLARGARVLDAFSYDGLFGIACALGGAREVVCLDSSEPALERARRNAERNGVAQRVRTEKADAMVALKERARTPERFELVIVDPPAFAKRKSELPGAERGYVELNRRAIELTAAGGYVVSASCSHHVLPEYFVAFLTHAADLARRDVWLEELAGASPDHPQLLSLPETAYLKCAFMRVGEIESAALADANVADAAPRVS